jgi:hypothetical protein
MMQISLKFDKELDYPVSEMPYKICKKIEKIWNKLETHISDISKCPERGYGGVMIKVSKEEVWYIYYETVVKHERNIIEIRKDTNRELENEIFKYLPLNMRKYAFNF